MAAPGLTLAESAAGERGLLGLVGLKASACFCTCARMSPFWSHSASQDWFEGGAFKASKDVDENKEPSNHLVKVAGIKKHLGLE